MSDALNRRAPVGSTRSALALLGFLAACFAVAGLGSVITTAQTAPGGWFETLEKPFFSPPELALRPGVDDPLFAHSPVGMARVAQERVLRR